MCQDVELLVTQPDLNFKQGYFRVAFRIFSHVLRHLTRSTLNLAKQGRLHWIILSAAGKRKSHLASIRTVQLFFVFRLIL